MLGSLRASSVAGRNEFDLPVGASPHLRDRPPSRRQLLRRAGLDVGTQHCGSESR